MSPTPKWPLLWPFLLTLIVPMVAAWFAYPTTHQPPGMWVFPPEQVGGTPGFSLLAFIIIGGLALLVTALILFPKLFGFQGTTPAAPTPTKPLPWWTWAGAVFMLVFWWIMWARPAFVGGLIYFAFSPMWWGFIVMLDGIVYHRNNGKSYITTKPAMFVFCLLISVCGWLYFEYYDYFVLANWYYPNGHMSELPHDLIVVLFLIAYTTVWPAIFEWFSLLNSFPKLVARYQNGPQLPLPANLLIWGGLATTVVMVFWPRPFFWAIWIGPMAVLTGTLLRLNVWNPFTSLTQGNWAPGVLIALSSLFNGFLWEMWNYGSEHSDIGAPTNPNYWIYDIPYVNVIHIFSEMPLLGYYGYVPFAALVWVFFIWSGRLCNRDTDIYLGGNPN